MSLRAIETLKSVDYILCEDTRRAQKLRLQFSISTKLVSFHEHNEKQRIPKILGAMQSGKLFALISDAGAPLISDPGALLVREVIANNLEFTFIPGPSAAICALVLSGFPLNQFMFAGFLPTAPGARRQTLEELKSHFKQTLVLFESPERILGLVREIGELLGNRKLAICRELTKLHEEVIRGTVEELIPKLAAEKMIGEFTVVIAPGEEETFTMPDESIKIRFDQLQKEGLSRKDALKKLMKESGRSRNDLYKLLMED